MSNEMLRQCADKGFVVGDKWRASPRQLVWRSHTLSVTGRGSGLYSIIELWPHQIAGRPIITFQAYVTSRYGEMRNVSTRKNDTVRLSLWSSLLSFVCLFHSLGNNLTFCAIYAW